MIKKYIDSLFHFFIEKETNSVLKKYKPKIVCVIGPGYRTKTAYVLETSLSSFYFVRRGESLGMTVLGFDDLEKNYWDKFLILVEGLALLFLPNHYPEFLIIEEDYSGADFKVEAGEKNGFKAEDYKVLYEGELPRGISFKVRGGKEDYEVTLDNTVGESEIEPVLSAFYVCEKLDLSLTLVSKNFSTHFLPLEGNMSLLKGTNESMLIDDSKDSSVESIIDGLKTLKGLRAERKIAVLGDILEIDKNSAERHKMIGKEITEEIDEVIIVGIRSKLIAEEAVEGGYSKDKIHHFNSSKDAGEFIRSFIQKKDVVYISGSNGMHMERVVERLI